MNLFQDLEELLQKEDKLFFYLDYCNVDKKWHSYIQRREFGVPSNTLGVGKSTNPAEAILSAYCQAYDKLYKKGETR